MVWYVYKWPYIIYDYCVGRLSTSITTDNIEVVIEIIQTNQWSIVDEISETLEFIYSGSWKINVSEHPISFRTTKWKTLHATSVQKLNGSFTNKTFSNLFENIKSISSRTIGRCVFFLIKCLFSKNHRTFLFMTQYNSLFDWIL